MMAAGLLDEVRTLYGRGDLQPDLPAMRAVGYRQLWRHLAGECSLEEAVAGAEAATRQLAKRQLTWLRKWPGLNWIVTNEMGNLAAGQQSDLAGKEMGEKPIQLALNYIEQAPL